MDFLLYTVLHHVHNLMEQILFMNKSYEYKKMILFLLFSLLLNVIYDLTNKSPPLKEQQRHMYGIARIWKHQQRQD
jgi:hypothetical protein